MDQQYWAEIHEINEAYDRAMFSDPTVAKAFEYNVLTAQRHSTNWPNDQEARHRANVAMEKARMAYETIHAPARDAKIEAAKQRFFERCRAREHNKD